MAAHTPLPWRVTGGLSGDAMIASDRDGYVPLRTPFREDAFRDGPDRSSHSNETLMANAALIVRAVNGHDELVSALRKAEEWIKGAYQESQAAVVNGQPRGFSLHDIRAAITKAEGGAA